MRWAQWESSLALNWLTDVADTTACGKAFQELITRELNEWRRVSVPARGFISFHS